MLKLIMKKILFVLFVFIVIICLFILKKNNCLNIQAKIYSINYKNYCLLTASSQEQWERGLMFYKKPVNFDGMVFVFPDKIVRSFWNKNTYMDLDLYWMNNNQIVGKSFLPSILKSKETIIVKSIKEVDRVVEIIR